MTVATMEKANATIERMELQPLYFATDLVVTPDDNPFYSPAQLADLLESMRAYQQLVPGWVCPSPDLPANQRLCLEGNRRLAVARQLGLPFWAFDLGRFVPEEERILLTFQHNRSRRQMSREELAQRAARYIEITHCTAATAAKLLNISEATLSRAFGDRRIPPELCERADRLGLSIRSLIAAMPVPLMLQAIEFCETPLGGTGKKPTRDQVSLFLQQLKKSGKGKARREKTVTLRMNGRTVSFTVGEKDSATSVSEDFKAIVAKLTKHADVPLPDVSVLFR